MGCNITHTISITHLINLELKLLGKTKNVDELVNLYNNCGDCLNFFKFYNLVDNLDFYYLINLAISNRTLMDNMSTHIETHYLNNLLFLNTKDSKFFKILLLNLDKLIPYNNNNKALTYLFSI